MPIPALHLDQVKMEPQPQEGLTVHEGEPNGFGYTLVDTEDDDGVHISVEIFECDPCRTSFKLEQNEIVHVLEGEVEISLGDGSKVELSPGGVAFLPKGQMTHWWFKSHFKELAIITG